MKEQKRALIIKGTEHTEEFVTQTTEEKLIEDVAKTIYADWGFGDWDKLMEAEKDTWRKTANQIHELYKKDTWPKGAERLPKLKVDPYSGFDGELCQQDMLNAGFKSTEEWKK